jgi:hypothetical protein
LLHVSDFHFQTAQTKCKKCVLFVHCHQI